MSAPWLRRSVEWARSLATAALRRAERVEAALARHPLRWALGSTAIFMLALFFGLTPQYGTNDDVGMMFIADGTLYGEPTPHLVFQNPAVGVVLSTLYDLTTAVNWYAVWLYGLHAGSLAVLLYLVFSDRRTRLLPRLLGLAGFLAVFTLWLWTNLQFTSTAITLGVTGVLLYASVALAERLPYRVLVLAGAMIGVASFVRWRSFQAVAVLAVPVAVATIRNVPWRRQAVFAGTALAIVAAGVVFTSVYYAGDDDWHDYLEFNSLRGKIHDTPRLRAATASGILDELRWSTADRDMFMRWFFMDEELYTTESLATIVEGTGSVISPVTDVLDITTGLMRSTRLVLLAGLFAGAWAMSRSSGRTFEAVMTLWVGGVLLGLAVFARIPDHVSLPILAGLGALYLARPGTLFRGEYRPPGTAAHRRWSLVALALLSTASLLAVALGVRQAVQTSAGAERRSDAFWAEMEDLAAYDPGAVYVSWSTSLRLNRVTPEDDEDVPVTLVPLGWHQRSPMHDDHLESLGIDDLYLAIATDPHVVLPLPGGRVFDRIFLTYVGEHYGIDRRWMRPVGRAGDVVTLYDMAVDYTFDGEVLTEHRADGTTITYTPEGVDIAGTVEIHPHQENALRGWTMVRGDQARPVERIVVVHGTEILDVTTTPFKRPGLADRFGLDQDTPLGFILPDLTDEQLTEIRIFGMSADTAVELRRRGE
jgi:hypothetical protein